MSETQVKPNKSHTIDLAVEIFKAAFHSDPLFVHFFPEEDKRKSQSQYTYKFIVRHAYDNGLIELGDGCYAAAILYNSANMTRGIWSQLRYGALQMLLYQKKSSIQKQQAASEYMQTIHKSLVPQNHYYLSMLGVHPDHKGKGLGGALVHRLIEQSIKDRPCYLDTHNEINIGFYERFGFKAIHEGRIPESDVRHWGMLRS